MPTGGLKPEFVAGLADDVYLLAREPSIEKAVQTLNAKHGELFSFDIQNTLKGKTGGPSFLKCRTAFGFALAGRGVLEGHVFFIFRGTQYLADHLTNLNFTVSRSSLGQPVHDGFGQALRSMRSQLQLAMGEMRGKTIHCIGHSLGGALATICAEWIVSAYRVKPFLYTFGSPRVGLHGFADICTKSIGSKNIYRVYHQTDLVPCLPIWPFIHVPNKGSDYFIPSPGMIPSIRYHDITTYINSVTGKNWASLSAIKPPRKSDAGIAKWLKDTTPIGMTVTTLEWLNHALVYVLNKCMNGAARVISQAASTSFTLLDSLAYILSKGVKIVETVSVWVVYLIRKIMIILGHQGAVDAADLTQHFIRTTLSELQQRANSFAKEALSNAFVRGRAI